MLGQMWTSDLVKLLIMGCVVAIPGAWAWGFSTARRWARLFQGGPALLIPALFVWTVISHATSPDEVEDWWRIAPFYGAIGAALVWHIALVARVRERTIFQIAYAVIFIPVFYLFCTLGMVLATKFPLSRL
jgi:hypothetical protein